MAMFLAAELASVPSKSHIMASAPIGFLIPIISVNSIFDDRLDYTCLKTGVANLKLRKISNHIKNGDWPIVFIELLVVFVGVYGAFQLERWGEERRESKNEWVLLEQLHNEIEIAYPRMEAQATSRRININDTLSAASVLMQPVGSGELPDDQCSQIFWVSVLGWQPLTLTTLDEMVSSGMHSHIDDRELRALLFSLNAGMQHFSGYMQLVRGQQIILMDMYPELLPRGVDENRETFFECNTDGMRASQAFINHLMSNIGRYGGMVRSLESELEDLRHIHDRLDVVLDASNQEKVNLHE